MAFINRGTGHDTFNIIWSIHNEMIVEAVLGILLTLAGGGEKSVDPASIIIKGINQANKVMDKKKKDELNASLHEETYIMTKDYIYKLGGLK